MSNDIMVTAVLDVLDKDRRPIQCRGLLDTCSTTNFITQRLADILKLPKNTLPDISHVVPDQPIQRNLIKIPGNIKLADPNFHKPAPVDMLLGAGTTLSLLSIGQIKLTLPYQQEMFLQKTLLGWIIGGSAPAKECPSFNKFTNDEEECEQHFRKHIDRDSDGRYIVALPFKPHSPKLGKLYHLALKRFENTERRLSKTPGQREAYNEVLNDYLKQNHMPHIQCDPTDIESYYLPHHAVIKETSMTTDLRVVFDGSFKTTTGVSLNDVLYTGSTIQPDLCTTLLRFHLHPIVITGDLKQMYRQFLVRKQDRAYQRIIWKDETNKMKIFELNTVTFGITCAPFLAIRCVQQLAEDEGKLYPLEAHLLLSDFYVDDFLSGAKTRQQAKLIIKQMIGILSKAGLTMRQWASNDLLVLENIPKEDINPRLQLGDTTLKTLGVYWDSDWDESLPIELHTEWMTYCQQLIVLNQLSFPCTIMTAEIQDMQIHGFSDASERAYGACIYLRMIDTSNNVKVQLLCAKFRVAPVKTITIPRLELCGAQLLATLTTTVTTAIKEKIKNIHYWTDSTIVLRWLQTSPQQLKTFVGHRVADIQNRTDINLWRHVPTQDNPADLVSRGLMPQDFLSANLWCNGPTWLLRPETEWPTIN
ncbi:uncharacterized protein LOC106693490 [Microplitis demolitor]|uniref:uncharacterized protein LOC106693490 n=1 Tax=Microplitis demolitor TaxID=69319 RepID=UPI0006D523B1|nr:uncharacterized protein LOC106693490 [Microplitis demolitor]